MKTPKGSIPFYNKEVAIFVKKELPKKRRSLRSRKTGGFRKQHAVTIRKTAVRPIEKQNRNRSSARTRDTRAVTASSHEGKRQIPSRKANEKPAPKHNDMFEGERLDSSVDELHWIEPEPVAAASPYASLEHSFYELYQKIAERFGLAPLKSN